MARNIMFDSSTSRSLPTARERASTITTSTAPRPESLFYTPPYAPAPACPVPSPVSAVYSPISNVSTFSQSTTSVASHMRTSSSIHTCSIEEELQPPLPPPKPQQQQQQQQHHQQQYQPNTKRSNNKTTPKMQFKRLSNHERYQLVKQNLGRPHVICHVVTYPLSALPAREFLEERIMELQAKLPMLYARLTNQLTNKPCFVPGDVPWDSDDIIVESSYIPLNNAANEAELVMKREMERFERYRFNKGDPMWTIGLVYGPGESQEERAYLVVQMNHILSDGRGSLAFLHALTAGSIERLPSEPFHKVRRLDDTVNIRPSPRYLAPIFWREVILPRLPKVIQERFVKEDCWPGIAVQRSPLVCAQGMAHTFVPPGTVTLLKEKAKRKGARTLHPLLKITYLAALWRTFGEQSYKPMFIVANTTRSERRAHLGHSAITNVYLGSMEYHLHLNGQESFWATALRCSKWLRSSRGIAEGRYTPGLLSHIDDPDVDPESPSFDPAVPTGWEKLFLGRASSQSPFRDTLFFHNLGPTKLPPGAKDYTWTQTANLIGPCITTSIVGHEGGLRLTAGFFEGSAVTRVRMEAMHSAWLRALDRIALSDEDMTLAELTA